jgi:negative regulator of sigma E activity
MKREDDEQLWDLLGRAPETKVSPFFARNVLRQVRQEQSRSGQSWFSWRRLVPASAVALAIAAAVVFVRNPAPQQATSSEPPVDPVIAQIDVQDYEVVADLDNLLASDENSPWDDNSSL